MKGFKVFNPDWKCNGFQYEVGESFKHDGELIICESGFHFCKDLIDCFNYYLFNPDNKVAEVEATGNIISNNDDKYVTDEIKIIRELSWNEVLELCNIGKHNSGYGNVGDCNSDNWNTGHFNSGSFNTGNRNTGYGNSGYHNTGNRNTGDSNSGYFNSGNYNSGNWNVGEFNSGNHNSGIFNNNTPQTFRIFNKDVSDDLLDEALSNDGYFRFRINFKLTEWIKYKDMSDEEKEKYPDAKNMKGYLKEYDYKKACENSWNRMSESEKAEFQKLPNFDPEIFKDITGIDINE